MRKRLSVTKWRTVETVKSFDDGKTNKTVVEWKADVIAEDRVPCKKTVSVGNISFRKQVNLLLAAKDPRTTVVAISAKRLGDGRSTTYDVELIADA